MNRKNIIFESIKCEIEKYKRGIHKLNKGASERSLELLEDELKLKLPSSYKEFLRLYNGGELFAPAGTVIAKALEVDEERKQGISYINDSFDENRRMLGIPRNYIIVACTSYGDCICLDMEASTEDDGIFVKWDHELGMVSNVWSGIAEWLKYELNMGKRFINYDGTDADIF